MDFIKSIYIGLLIAVFSFESAFLEVLSLEVTPKDLFEGLLN
jgi:hypothetical protein